MDIAAPHCGGGPVNDVLVEQHWNCGVILRFVVIMWNLVHASLKG